MMGKKQHNESPQPPAPEWFTELQDALKLALTQDIAIAAYQHLEEMEGHLRWVQALRYGVKE